MTAKDIPQQSQRQDSLLEQLNDLLLAARRLGLYDAEDLIRDKLKLNLNTDE